MLELAGIIILGILAQWVAWKFKIPAILPLILIGLLVGPIAAEFLSEDGTKWIEPIWNGSKGLFPGACVEFHVDDIVALTAAIRRIVSTQKDYETLCEAVAMKRSQFCDRSKSWGSMFFRALST